jgi:hypothetical protein
MAHLKIKRVQIKIKKENLQQVTNSTTIKTELCKPKSK